MALTPLDIQNKDFSTKMRGYNQDDVDDFLDQVTRDYEDALQKNRELEKSLKHAEEKLQCFNELLLHKIPLIKGNQVPIKNQK